METFATIVNGQKLLTIVAKLSILYVCGVPDNASVTNISHYRLLANTHQTK